MPTTFTAFSVKPLAFYPRPHDGVLDATKISWATDRPAIEQVIVRNDVGHVLRRISLGYEGTGAHTARWNGRNSTGRWAQPGRYRIVVRAAREGYAVLGPVGHVRLRWGSP